MFDVSAGELGVVILVATLALGPGRAAALLRRLARWLDTAEARWRGVARSVEGDHDAP